MAGSDFRKYSNVDNTNEDVNAFDKTEELMNEFLINYPVDIKRVKRTAEAMMANLQRQHFHLRISRMIKNRIRK